MLFTVSMSIQDLVSVCSMWSCMDMDVLPLAILVLCHALMDQFSDAKDSSALLPAELQFFYV